MIDTHSHIDGPEFAEDLEETINRAKAAGIEKIFVPASAGQTLLICLIYATSMQATYSR